MTVQNLNNEQSDAVESTDGPLLVLAGAGTGKTKVLTSRIIHIVNSFKASPHQILAVTFTNKAAAEMKHRMEEVIGDQVNNLWVGTFHSIASRILRRHPEVVGLRSDFTIIDSDDQTRLLKQIITDFNIDLKQFPAKNYLSNISRLKDKIVGPMAMKTSGADVSLPKLKEVYEIYQNRLKAMNAADFGDLLAYNVEIFQKAPEVLAYYQDKFKYVLVDEYQDTNGAQYQWLLSLAALHQNICCVGDDDQSIYSWRGADVANILRFEKDFPDAKIVRLEQNYRSTGRILDAAYSVISNNKDRHSKKLWTDVGKGEKVKVLAFNDDRSESSTIASMIKDYISNQKFKLSEIAILVRAGYQTRSFEEAFIHNSLPYKVIGGMKFYERLEIRDAIAYLRIAANLDDDLALSRIINTPKRGAGNAAMSNLYQKSKQEGISFFRSIKKSLEDGLLKGKARESLGHLMSQIERANTRVGTMDLGELARTILNEVGYMQMWKTENTLESQGRLENIEEFISSLSDFSNMVEFLEYVSLIEARADKNLKDAVTVMTVHGAKGLEFDLVFAPGLEDGIFPSSRSVDERNGLEEERRLMYVAITRARKKLVLSHAKTRYIFGDYQAQMPSRFLKELPDEGVEFEEVAFGSEFLFNKRSQQSQNSGSSFGGGYQGATKNSYGNGRSSFAKSSSASQPISFGGSLNKNMNKTTSSSLKSTSSLEDSMSGKRVFHQKFGYGKVIGADGKKLEIQFEKSGTKTVMKDFVSLA